jgi:hypothetical protein
MRFFFSGPRILGIRPGIFGADKIASSGGSPPPTDDGYLFGSLPPVIRHPLRIIVGLICGVILFGALMLLRATITD